MKHIFDDKQLTKLVKLSALPLTMKCLKDPKYDLKSIR